MTTKIDRTDKHIAELTEYLSKTRPFRYVLEGNAHTGECATFAEKDEAAANEAALIAADAIHNLRSALDHAYWEIVSPLALSPGEAKAVQFPFSATEHDLVERIKNRLAHKVSDKFFDAVVSLKPHGEAGGNRMLYALHHFDGIDKHRKLIPFGDYKKVVWADLKRQIPDLPAMPQGATTMGMSNRDIVWRIAPMTFWPPPGIIKSELNVPITVAIDIGNATILPMVEAIKQMRDATLSAIDAMRRSL